MALPPNPSSLLYPGGWWYPTENEPYEWTIPSDFLYPSLSFYPSSHLTRRTVVYGRTTRETVGPPHPGNHPRPRRLPGAHDDVPVIYQRIHYPSDTISPDRGLYPYDESPHFPTSYYGQVAVLRSGLRLRPSRASGAFSGVARFIVRLRFDIFGVLASGADRKLRTVVELATISETAQMGSFDGPAELGTFDAQVELL